MLLPERLHGLSIGARGISQSLGFVFKLVLGDFGQFRKEECSSDRDTETRDGEVDPLDVGEVVGVLTGEKVLGSDQRTGKRSDTVERLRKLETEIRDVGRGHDRYVRVGRDFERGETAGSDGRADDETAKDRIRVGGADRELGDGPEKDGTGRVQGETHDDGEFVAAALQDFGGDGREGKVTDTKVGGLETGRLDLGDAEDVLEVLVEDIEETVCETPEEEEGGDETEGPDWGSA